MQPIPVTFTFEGKEYKGSLSKVSGGGSSGSFHLTVNGRHWGQLFYGADRWYFFSNSMPGMSALAEEFGYVVTAWYE